MKSSEKILEEIKGQGFFTSSLTLDKFVEDLCKRYARITGEILNPTNLDNVVLKLKENGFLEDDEVSTTSV